MQDYQKLSGQELADAIAKDVEAFNKYRKKNTLWEPNLSRSNLINANLINANLYSANLSDANLSDANLQFANLQDANLRLANLQDANLSDANLHGTGIVALQVGPFWVVVTPDEAFIGCERRPHKKWESLTQEQAARMDRGDVMWAYRPLLLEAMRRCRVLGWPKQEGEAA